jgi:hypothetical protein
MEGGRFVPLGFADLASISDQLGQPVTLPLQIVDVRITAGRVGNLGPGDIATASGTLESTLASRTLALVMGGWMPSGIAARNAVLLPDRCTMGSIRKRFVGGARTPNVQRDFLDFLANEPVRINPMLYVMEGSSGRASPDAEEVANLFDNACKKIEEALPRAIIVTNRGAAIEAIHSLIVDSAEDFAARMSFLRAAMPLLANPTGRAARAGIWEQLIKLAREHGIATSSILFTAVLSATSATLRCNPARTLLKPKSIYRERDAYNALSDLRALDMLIRASAFFPAENMAILTDDKALALLWTGLQVRDVYEDNHMLHYTMNPHEGLFSSLQAPMLGEALRILESNERS